VVAATARNRIFHSPPSPSHIPENPNSHTERLEAPHPRVKKQPFIETIRNKPFSSSDPPREHKDNFPCLACIAFYQPSSPPTITIELCANSRTPDTTCVVTLAGSLLKLDGEPFLVPIVVAQ
jgi:hypothetical protein